MTTLAQLRKAALALPEVEEGTHLGRLAFKVRGKGFVSVSKEGIVQLSLSDDDSGGVLTRFEHARRVTRSGRPNGVCLPLSSVNGMQINSLVEKAWMNRAPKKLVVARREANRGEAPPGPDALPRSIGKPATRALLGAGVRSLSDVARWSEDELLAMHGVGPKATRLLGEALAQRGLSFKSG